VEAQLCKAIESQIRKVDVILVSDYDKGVCTPCVTATVIKVARACNLRVLVDPIRGGNYRKYHSCSAVTPNRLEAGLATGSVVACNEDAFSAGCRLLGELDLEAAIVTLDKDGMALVHRDGRRQVFPTRQRQVYDITGAGDMVLSVLGMALAAGADYEPAIRLANIAGGLEVEKIGVATVTRDEILRDLLRIGTIGNQKVLEFDALCREIDSRRRLGQRIAFTNGCFDVLHAGHVEYLHEARAQADVLVVGLNSDASVRGQKGPGRPINHVHARAQVLTGLEAIDYLTIFDEATPLHLIQAVRPDVLVKGADYRKDEVVGGQFVESYGGRIYLAPFKEGYSTTRLLQQLGAA
jgi:D-beta-D-heptose 7-phosphate kinase/D-beta-D-heptose 1-phosphate adenosyltransferase